MKVRMQYRRTYEYTVSEGTFTAKISLTLSKTRIELQSHINSVGGWYEKFIKREETKAELEAIVAQFASDIKEGKLEDIFDPLGNDY